MKVPYTWLCDFSPFANLDSDSGTGSPSPQLVAKLVDAMNDLGLVVEGVDTVGEGLEKVVVAQVVEISPIEGADRIRKVMVRADEDDLIQIVCGAFNFIEGDKVPLAKVGAVLPGDFAIAKRKMRGIESHGMLCSPTELKLGGDKGGLLILPQEYEVGAPLKDAMGLSVDVVFDLAIENNRPDANCVLGVARDLAAWFGLPFEEPTSKLDMDAIIRADSNIQAVEVHCPTYCDRLLVAIFDNVQPKPTSAKVARRLELAGMRTVSPIVDISNYLMLELGQPTHPYDIETLAGGVISVRLAKSGEVLRTLDGAERILGLPDVRGRDSTDLVIVDGDDRPVGLAGIMGGAGSEISATTKRVLLEIAHFDPMTIARTSKRLGLRSEASARFERGVDPSIIEYTLSRFSEMIGQEPINVVNISAPDALTPVVIKVRASRVNSLLGTALSVETIADILRPLGFTSSVVNSDLIQFSVPKNRVDVEREVDVIEEIARHHGYAKIEKIRPNSKITGALSPKQKFRRSLGSLASGNGFYESWTPTLLAPGEQERIGNKGPYLEVENPLAKDESVLRRSLLPGLIRALRFNSNRGEKNLRFFEIGKVFSLDNSEIAESERIAFLLSYKGDGVNSALAMFSKIADFYHLRRVDLVNGYQIDSSKEYLRMAVEKEAWHGLHPTRHGYLVADKRILGVVGEIDPVIVRESEIDSIDPVGYLELDLDLLLSHVTLASTMAPVSPFPAAQVDLAFEVPEGVSAWDIREALLSQVSKEIVSATLFDVFRGPSLPGGVRSLAFSVKMSNSERTFTEADISSIRQKCIDLVEKRFEAKLRS